MYSDERLLNVDLWGLGMLGLKLMALKMCMVDLVLGSGN